MKPKPKERQVGEPAGERRRRTGLKAILLLAFVAAAACDVDPTEQRDPPQDPSREIEPDPELGPSRGDIDINARAREAEARRAQAEPPPADDAATPGDAPGAGDAAGPGNPPGAGGRVALAELRPTEGNDARGTVRFVENDQGVTIEAMLTGLTPGPHGIHIHENGDCSAPDASSAGAHFARRGERHGGPTSPPGQHHAGDLGNISADESGAAKMRMTHPELTFEGELGIVGRAVIVHAGEDDLMTQPSGDSGPPVACGVIERFEPPTSTERAIG